MADSGHKAGPLKQSNKGHKAPHRSKGQIKREFGGRTDSLRPSNKHKIEISRMQRKNKSKMQRKQQRIQDKERLAFSAPLLIALIDISGSPFELKKIWSLIVSASNGVAASPEDAAPITLTSSLSKRRFTLVPTARDIESVLEMGKVADCCIFVSCATDGVDVFGTTCISALCAQGLPTSLHIVHNLSAVPSKQQAACKRDLAKSLADLVDGKVFFVDSVADAKDFLWPMMNQTPRDIRWRDVRSHMLVDTMKYDASDESMGTLSLTGFVRGRAWNVDELVYLPGFGCFQLESIAAAADSGKRHTSRDAVMEAAEAVILAVPQEPEPLEAEAVVNPDDGEQTWPTEEELGEAEGVHTDSAKALAVPVRRVKVPKGWSSYQAAWIAESASEHDSDEDSNGSDGMEDVGAAEDDAESSDASSDEESMAEVEEGGKVRFAEEADDAQSVGGNPQDRSATYDAGLDAEDEQAALAAFRSAADDRKFPDEVDTPMDQPARIRFAKYRGLQSFRNSPWDPKEDLPHDYARLFQFSNFAATRKRVMAKAAHTENKAAAALEVGEYITLRLANVPASAAEAAAAATPLVAFALLRHENRMSVLNLHLRMHPSWTAPIRSKEQLIFCIGARVYRAGALFSQTGGGNKHKFERFFQAGSFAVASIYGPTVFPPTPVLVFKEVCPGHVCLIATGSVLSVDPSRVVVKRIRLSGHPLKINKKSAVVRYMFFTPEDISWFKPIELVSKFGRRGHIKESLGTHGHMKVVFDNPLKADDTVLMNLYKRVYPKWTFAEHSLRGAVLQYDQVAGRGAGGAGVAMDDE